jgi:hypothetical protein
MPDQQAPQAQEIHTRFLFPFLFERGKNEDMVKSLQGLRIEVEKNGAKQAIPVWQSYDELQALAKAHNKARTRQPDQGDNDKSPLRALFDRYSEELTQTVSEFLFPGGGAPSCHYLRIEEQAQRWFRNYVTVAFGGQTLFAARLDAPRVEVFLSCFGAGVLSISLRAKAKDWPERGAGIPLQELKHFNYRLAQMRRPKTLATLGIPHPNEKLPDGKALADQARIPPPPAADAPLDQRLGAAGGRFTLPELVDFLLGPLQQSKEYHYTQAQQHTASTAWCASAARSISAMPRPAPAWPRCWLD